MKDPAFLFPYVMTSLLTAIGVYVTGYIDALAEHQQIGWIYWSFFVVFVGIAYIIGRKLAQLPNPNTYTQYMLGLIGLKMVLCAFIVFSCAKLLAPTNNQHVFIFLFLYIIFSILEYTLLSKLAYQQKK